MRLVISVLTLLTTSFSLFGADADVSASVLKRLGASDKIKVKFESLEKVNGCDQVETLVENDVLTIRGSSPVAQCRGFYDYTKRNGFGIVSWSGNRFAFPSTLPNEGPIKTVAPVPYFNIFNTCTFGYTMPFWTWERWEQELDWMAVHGINMPLALNANEAIGMRVWKRFGLTDTEINDFYTGPSHLPWQRMGNIEKLCGPLPAEWHDRQVILQHKILNRMRELGMKPICPAFAGFIPRGFKRLYPNLKMHLAGWVNRPEWARPMLLAPDEPIFTEIGKAFIEEWEKEFGKCDFYLSDMFNEMEVPVSKKDKTAYCEYMAKCGEAAYRSVTAGNPDATWVMQGWILNYQRNIWSPEAYEALISRIPKEKYIILDLGTDWNTFVWKNGTSFEKYTGFFGAPWIYSVVPNMGGRNILTGDMEYYANGHLDALNSKNRGKLVGFGNATEALNQNEVLFEIFFDSVWKTTRTDTAKWMENYAVCRYGKCPEAIKESFKLLRDGVYSHFSGLPCFGWMEFPPTRGRPNRMGPDFMKALELFASVADEMKSSPLYMHDLKEYTAHYLSVKMQDAVMAMIDAFQNDDPTSGETHFKDFEKMGLEADMLLNQHPYLNLKTWIDFARKNSDSPAIQDYYEWDARTLISIWQPVNPLSDYACKNWGGVIKSFNIERWRLWKDVQLGKVKENRRRQFDFDWAKMYGAGAETVEKMSNDAVIALARTALRDAAAIKPYTPPNRPIAGQWTPQNVTEAWQTLTFQIPQHILPKLCGVRFVYNKGRNRLDIRRVSVEADGISVAECVQDGEASGAPKRNMYKLKIPAETRANNSCELKLEVKTHGGTESFGKVELILAP